MQNTLREFRGRVTIGNADIIYNTVLYFEWKSKNERNKQ